MITLHSVEALLRFPVDALDGNLGLVVDVLFDDKEWTVRHLVVDTGHRLGGRRILVPATMLTVACWRRRGRMVRLTRQQVQRISETSLPSFASDLVHQERAMFVRFGVKWSASRMRSCREVTGYDIHADDGAIGHVDDFLFDESHRRIRMLVVDTRNCQPRRHVLISPMRIARVSWETGAIELNVSRAQVDRRPDYDPCMSSLRLMRHHLYRSRDHPRDAIGH